MNELGSAVYSVAFSHGSGLLASLGQNIKLWKTSTWECLHTLVDSTTLICLNSVKFSHDSKLLASDSSDDVLILWDTSSGKQVRTLSGHQSTVISVAFSHDSNPRVVGLWDTTSGQHLNNFKSHCHASPISSDDSELLASVSGRNHYYVKVWDARDGQCLQKIKAWNSSLYNSRLVSKVTHLNPHSSDRIARVWEPHNLECWQGIVAKMGVKQCFLDNPNPKSLDGTSLELVMVNELLGTQNTCYGYHQITDQLIQVPL
ncbi:uncharacterized protein N7503_003580 [Penicillium pulvis]|uniref:uncharacterized protein n=1 Tax=Penicillium pulvis TaxID=1562058 RepID=UPI002547CCD8|nr:uncharacterized protein N7503_003580 [Penicillium pulvis]KAJ5805978.1 hypothetical protein N7503_003580 [Penicillium pulvis]